MKIILSTYNFYPSHKGGTEVYTKALAEYLLARQHEVLIIAALDEGMEAQDGSVLRMDDSEMKVVQYRYEGLDVLAIQLKQQHIDDIYSMQKPVWTSGFKQLLSDLGWKNVQHLIMNGISTVSGLSLCDAVYELNPAVKIDVIVHTPFICPKADMLYEKTGTRCQVHIKPRVCATCMVAANTKLSYTASHLLTFAINISFLTKLSKATGVRLQYLLKEKIKGFGRLNDKIHKWIVFAEDMKQFMAKQSFISESKIMVLRHGINTAVFYEGEPRAARPVTFLYAGRFEDIKGVNVLAEAWQQLPDQPAERLLYLAGNWNESDTGRNIKAALQSRKDVVFMPNLSQQQLADQYRKTHCVIIPSKWVETGPMVFHEAVACGCDIISSDIGGQGELTTVYNDKSLAFESGNSKKLSEAILSYQPTGKKSRQPVKSSLEHFEQLSAGLMIA